MMAATAATGRNATIVQSNPRRRTQGYKSDPDEQRQEEVSPGAEEAL